MGDALDNALSNHLSRLYASARGGAAGAGRDLPIKPPKPGAMTNTLPKSPSASDAAKMVNDSQTITLPRSPGAFDAATMMRKNKEYELNVNGAPVKKKPTGPVGPTGPAAPVVDPLDAMYEELRSSIGAIGKGNSANYDAILRAITGNYSAAGADNYKQYMGSRDSLTEAAKNLGVDFNNSDMGKAWDNSARRIQEMADSNKVSDLNWVEKMKGLDANQINYLLASVDQDKLTRKQELALAKLSASRGGRSGGGSGGSKLSGSATETSTVNNVGDMELYNELLKTNPAAAQLFYNAYWSSGGKPIDGVGRLLTQQSNIQKAAVKKYPKSGNIGGMLNKGFSKAAQNYNPAIQSLQSLTGLWGNPTTKQVVSQKGKP